MLKIDTDVTYGIYLKKYCDDTSLPRLPFGGSRLSKSSDGSTDLDLKNPLGIQLPPSKVPIIEENFGSSIKNNPNQVYTDQNEQIVQNGQINMDGEIVGIQIPALMNQEQSNHESVSKNLLQRSSNLHRNHDTWGMFLQICFDLFLGKFIYNIFRNL